MQCSPLALALARKHVSDYTGQRADGVRTSLQGKILHWERLERLVVIIIDQSSSMDHILDAVRRSVGGMTKAGFGYGTDVHFITFDHRVGDSSSLEDLPASHGTTRIMPAFMRMRSLIQKHGTPKSLDVVFVSDGEDDKKKDAFVELALMPAPLCPSRLFPVGVGRGFPSTLVFDTLMPVFGTLNDPTMAAVLPLETAEESDYIFEILGDELRTTAPRTPPTLEELRPGLSLDALYSRSFWAYNACMNRVFVGRKAAVASAKPGELNQATVEALGECLAIQRRVASLVLETMRAAKRGRVVASVTCRATPHGVLEAVHQFIQRIKGCMDRVSYDSLLHGMSDDDKRNVAGLAGRLAPFPPVYMHVRAPVGAYAQPDASDSSRFVLWGARGPASASASARRGARVYRRGGAGPTACAGVVGAGAGPV